jgi:hypothetical protein
LFPGYPAVGRKAKRQKNRGKARVGAKRRESLFVPVLEWKRFITASGPWRKLFTVSILDNTDKVLEKAHKFNLYRSIEEQS